MHFLDYNFFYIKKTIVWSAFYCVLKALLKLLSFRKDKYFRNKKLKLKLDILDILY